MNSSFPNITLSKSNFLNCQWQEVVNNSEIKICPYYSSRFLDKAKEAEQNGNTELQITLLLLSGITSPALKGESKDKPFAYMDFIDQISDEYLTVLQDWVSDISDFELKARVADILWIRKRNYRMAQEAIDCYLESAKKCN